ncbi:MAG: ribosome maturation factor RimP [Oscillospiraceae bacterium]|jgi:ribosome maturation factor RimP
MNKVAAIVSELAQPVVEKHGCQLWDVEYVKEAGTWYLRVYIDKADGVGIDDCEAISRELDVILDEVDPIPGSYVFEVSSAGAERALKRPSDFELCMGRTVEVKLYKAEDGKKSFVGTLSGYYQGDVTLEVDGVSRTFKKEQIAQVRLRIIW